MRENTNKEEVKEQESVSRAGRMLLKKLEIARKKKEAALSEERVEYYIGIDLGDRKSYYCILDTEANILVEGSFPTTAQASSPAECSGRHNIC